MRKSAEFTMENDKGTLSVRLQELTVREVLDMCEQFGKGPLVHDLERLLPRMSNLTTNDLMDMTPGELEMLWEQVKEVNAAFFRIAGALGFGRVLEAFRAQLRSDLMEAALNGNSSVRGCGWRGPGTGTYSSMGGARSSKRLRPRRSAGTNA